MTKNHSFRSNIIQRNSLCRAVAGFILLTFTTTQSLTLFPPNARAQTVMDLPVPGTMLTLTTPFTPPVLRGLTIHPENPLKFDFIVDKGETSLKGDELKKEYEKLIKYFLATLAIPEDDLWVNLSPYEKERIIPNEFGLTEMGRDLLAQDYILKQLMASLTYPESGLGKKFWDEIYKKAYEQYGTTNIPLNTFNKVWIVPDKAVVYENKDKAFIVESHLKVMIEEDYLALAKNMKNEKMGTTKQKEEDVKAISNVSSLIAKEILIPAIEKEVNENKNFAQLRQIYASMILAAWYKKTLKDNLLNKVYSNKKKINGVGYNRSVILSGAKDLRDPSSLEITPQDDVEVIYQQYIAAFKTGVYNMIKEDHDQYMGKVIPRKYFSGGFEATDMAALVEVTHDMPPGDLQEVGQEGRLERIEGTYADPQSSNPAQPFQFTRREFSLGAVFGVLFFPSWVTGQTPPSSKGPKDDQQNITFKGFDAKHFQNLAQREGIAYLETFSEGITAGRISKSEAAVVLRKLFSDNFFLWVRLKALEILAKQQILTVEEIVGLSQNSAEPQIRKKAPELFVLHGTVQAKAKLFEMILEASSSEEKTAVIHAIAQLADGDAEKILLDWIEKEKDLVLLSVLAEEVGHIHTPKVEEKLFVLRRHENPYVQAAAIKGLGYFGSEKAFQEVAKSTQSSHRFTHLFTLPAAVEALGYFENAEAEKILVKLSNSSDSTVKQAAVKGLSHLNSPLVQTEFLRLLMDSDQLVAELTADLSGQIKQGQEKLEAQILILLKLPNAKMYILLRALSSMRSKKAEETLVNISPNASLQETVIEGLGKIGTQKAVQRLIEMGLKGVKDPNIVKTVGQSLNESYGLKMIDFVLSLMHEAPVGVNFALTEILDKFIVDFFSPRLRAQNDLVNENVQEGEKAIQRYWETFKGSPATLYAVIASSQELTSHSFPIVYKHFLSHIKNQDVLTYIAANLGNGLLHKFLFTLTIFGKLEEVLANYKGSSKELASKILADDKLDIFLKNPALFGQVISAILNFKSNDLKKAFVDRLFELAKQDDRIVVLLKLFNGSKKLDAFPDKDKRMAELLKGKNIPDLPAVYQGPQLDWIENGVLRVGVYWDTTKDGERKHYKVFPQIFSNGEGIDKFYRNFFGYTDKSKEDAYKDKLAQHGADKVLVKSFPGTGRSVEIYLYRNLEKLQKSTHPITVSRSHAGTPGNNNYPGINNGLRLLSHCRSVNDVDKSLAANPDNLSISITGTGYAQETNAVLYFTLEYLGQYKTWGSWSDVLNKPLKAKYDDKSMSEKAKSMEGRISLALNKYDFATKKIGVPYSATLEKMKRTSPRESNAGSDLKSAQLENSGDAAMLAASLSLDFAIASDNRGGSTRRQHEAYHESGQFAQVIKEIALEIGAELRADGKYDLRQSVVEAGRVKKTSHGELRIEKDGSLVIIDRRFQKDHAGRGERAVYARTEAKAQHELSELRDWINFALEKGIVTQQDVVDGKLGIKLQIWANENSENRQLAEKLRDEFHNKALKVEFGYQLNGWVLAGSFTQAVAEKLQSKLTLSVIEYILSQGIEFEIKSLENNGVHFPLSIQNDGKTLVISEEFLDEHTAEFLEHEIIYHERLHPILVEDSLAAEFAIELYGAARLINRIKRGEFKLSELPFDMREHLQSFNILDLQGNWITEPEGEVFRQMVTTNIFWAIQRKWYHKGGMFTIIEARTVEEDEKYRNDVVSRGHNLFNKIQEILSTQQQAVEQQIDDDTPFDFVIASEGRMGRANENRVTPATTNEKRLESSDLHIEEILDHMQNPSGRPLTVVDFGSGIPPVTTQELALRLAGKAKVIGIDPAYPVFRCRKSSRTIRFV